MFENDSAAFRALNCDFAVSRGGIIYMARPRTTTEYEWNAINYLILEWDYGFSFRKPPDVQSAEAMAECAMDRRPYSIVRHPLFNGVGFTCNHDPNIEEFQ